MNLAVTGGRDVHVSDEDFEWLLEVYKAAGGTCFILGDCPTGVDHEVMKRLAEMDEDCEFVVDIADWRTHGRAAGPLRNQEMIDEADALAAFNGGRGTADCVRRAKAKGIPIFRRNT